MKWLRELGAVRPMAPTGNTVLVLGEWKDGFYPIKYNKIKPTRSWDGDKWVKSDGSEEWFLFGELSKPLSRSEVVEILNQSN